jgi:GNAT superfamily N-acetyltransferase
MDLEIRTGTESDLPDILRLYAEPGMDNGRVLTIEAATQVFRRMSTYPNYRIYVAALEGSTVGTFALLIMDNLAHMGTTSAVIEDFCVTEQLRGQGVGSRMMKFAMEIAREHGCYKLSLSSNAVRGQAHTFYRSLGFEQHGLSFYVGLSRPSVMLSSEPPTPHGDASKKVVERS